MDEVPLQMLELISGFKTFGTRFINKRHSTPLGITDVHLLGWLPDIPTVRHILVNTHALLA